MTSRAALLRHPLAIAGAVLTTVSAVAFVAFLIALWTGLFPSPYSGLIVVVALPALFVLGLLMMPAGMWLERRARERAGVERDWPVVDFRIPHARRIALAIVALTAVNLIIIAVAATETAHVMDSPQFCGTTCHTPMEPQYTAWQGAIHGSVKCTECHVGEGARALVKSKLAGTRQLYHVLTNQVPTPIPAVADMRPAIETCGNCHWAGRFIPEAVHLKREYADDEENTETITKLTMMLGGPGGRKASSGKAIHWHADPDVHIEFVSPDEERQTIPYVRLVAKDGTVKEFKAEGTTDAQIASGHRRVMDCIDCHNTAAHRIAPTPEQAVDRAIAAGDITRKLPFIRREAVKLVKADYPSKDQGLAAIEKGLQEFYTGKPVDKSDLAHGIASVQNVYRRNVFPAMKVTFGVYPDNIGHITSMGCFRCHDDGHTAADGTAISGDCELCHTME